MTIYKNILLPVVLYPLLQVTIYKNILRGTLRFPSALKDLPAKDIVKKLLTANPSQRLGCLKGGASDVRHHEFFRKVDWVALLQRRVPPPIKPVLKSPTVRRRRRGGGWPWYPSPFTLSPFLSDWKRRTRAASRTLRRTPASRPMSTLGMPGMRTSRLL